LKKQLQGTDVTIHLAKEAALGTFSGIKLWAASHFAKRYCYVFDLFSIKKME
jgi:hypothetical protein